MPCVFDKCIHASRACTVCIRLICRFVTGFLYMLIRHIVVSSLTWLYRIEPVNVTTAPASSVVAFLWSPYVIGQTIIFLPCGYFFLSFLWPPYVIGGPLYFCPVVSFYLLSIFFFFFPRLISAATDWMSTILRHMVWP